MYNHESNPINFNKLAAALNPVAPVQSVKTDCEDTKEFEGPGVLTIPAGAYSIKWENIEQEPITLNGETISAGGGDNPQAVFNPVSNEWELLGEYVFEVPDLGCIRYTVCKPLNLPKP